MHNAPKPKKVYESIEDGSFVNQAMQDIVDSISPKQLKELDEAISEAVKGDTIFWEEFKKEILEWRKR